MLVLTRKLGEKIMIEGGIVVTVVKVDRGKVRLGIDAPVTTHIYREELLPDRRETPQREAQHTIAAASPHRND